MKKNFSRLLTASIVVGSLNFAPAIYIPDSENLQIISVAHAEVKMYTATGEDYPSQFENQEIAKLRAKEKAIKKAVEQAGVYLQSYTRTINGVLTDDEISAVASNTYQLIGEVKYERSINQITDETTVIIWKATVQVNVDDAEIKKWMDRQSEEKSNIVAQNKENQRAAAENDRQIEDLRKRAKTEGISEQIKSEFEIVDNDFLYNQKIDEGVRLLYDGNYKKAIEVYTEAIKMNPNNAVGYCARGNAYNARGGGFSAFANDKVAAKENYNLALADANKAIELNPNYSEAYRLRSTLHFALGEREKQFLDINKAIELDPNNAHNYHARALWYGYMYSMEKLYKKPITQSYVFQATEDFNKAIELEPDNANFYYSRAGFYSEAEMYDRAIEDYTKAIQLVKDERMLQIYYCGRGKAYQKLKNYSKAIEDYNKAIEINPKSFLAYQSLGYLYEEMGDKAKSKEYLKKFEELLKADQLERSKKL